MKNQKSSVSNMNKKPKNYYNLYFEDSIQEESSFAMLGDYIGTSKIDTNNYNGNYRSIGQSNNNFIQEQESVRSRGDNNKVKQGISSNELENIVDMVTKRISQQINVANKNNALTTSRSLDCVANHSNNQSNNNHRNNYQDNYDDDRRSPRKRVHNRLDALEIEDSRPKIFDLETEMWKINRRSEKEMLSLHPYLNYLYCFAYTRMCKDLKLVDDWTLQRCIHRWFEKDPMSDHKKNVAYLLSKIPFSFINVKANQSSPSLMVRVLNAVDSCWFASNKGLDHAAINEILNDFKAEQIFDVQGNTRSVNPNSNNFNTNNNNNAPTGSGQSSFRSSFKTCNLYNKDDSCRYEKCRFLHQCAAHAKIGKRANHPASECKMQEEEH